MTNKKQSETITAFKGFSANMQCRGYQFKLGESYTHEGPVEACESGFHSVEYPMDVFGYYAPSCSVYAEVEASGTIARHPGDSKVASAKLHIRAALTIPDLVARAIEWVTKQCNPARSNHATADQSASSATGYSSASSATGYSSASSATGDSSASSATGYRSASSATGYRSASSATGDSSASSATGYSSASSATGDRSASSATGHQSASSATGYSSASSATGYRSASSATGDSSASSATGYSSASSATGDSSASSATGYRSASSATGDSSASSATGDRSASLNTGSNSSSEIKPHAEGKELHAVAIATGYESKARAPAGSAIVLVERNDEGEIVNIRASKVGENGVNPDTWYTLRGGEFVVAG